MSVKINQISELRKWHQLSNAKINVIFWDEMRNINGNFTTTSMLNVVDDAQGDE